MLLCSYPYYGSGGGLPQVGVFFKGQSARNAELPGFDHLAGGSFGAQDIIAWLQKARRDGDLNLCFSGDQCTPGLRAVVGISQGDTQNVRRVPRHKELQMSEPRAGRYE